MFALIDRYPTRALWLIAFVNGAAMLGINVLLRAIVQ